MEKIRCITLRPGFGGDLEGLREEREDMKKGKRWVLTGLFGVLEVTLVDVEWKRRNAVSGSCMC